MAGERQMQARLAGGGSGMIRDSQNVCNRTLDFPQEER